MAVRILHLSDVHVTAEWSRWRLRNVLSKQPIAWANWRLLGRGKRFADAVAILKRFREEVRSRKPDLVVFSGDAMALGFGTEAQLAADLMNVTGSPGIAVPGNHDRYTRRLAHNVDFEISFGPWLAGERIDNQLYPFARCVGGVWFIAVNSAVPNRLFFDARGRVGTQQLDLLDQLLTRLPVGPRVLVTHYPYCTARGVAEPHWHGLRDREELAALVRKHDVKLWLCGHRHHPYRVGPTAEMPFEVICAGSATMRGTAGFWEIVIDGNCVTAERIVL